MNRVKPNIWEIEIEVLLMSMGDQNTLMALSPFLCVMQPWFILSKDFQKALLSLLTSRCQPNLVLFDRKNYFCCCSSSLYWKWFSPLRCQIMFFLIERTIFVVVIEVLYIDQDKLLHAKIPIFVFYTRSVDIFW